ncbi:hypothetical protein IWQ60_012356, partial [Tieghemiomyces parasiticus]
TSSTMQSKLTSILIGTVLLLQLTVVLALPVSSSAPIGSGAETWKPVSESLAAADTPSNVKQSTAPTS